MNIVIIYRHLHSAYERENYGFSIGETGPIMSRESMAISHNMVHATDLERSLNIYL